MAEIYIRLEDAVSAFHKRYREAPYYGIMNDDDAIDILCDVPETELQPVIRCKECQHGLVGETNVVCMNMKERMPIPRIHELEWFCADGAANCGADMGDMGDTVLTLEDAIAHLDESLSDPKKEWGCETCRLEHEQLRAWLVELWGYRKIVTQK